MKKNILIVDDDEDIVRLIYSYLQDDFNLIQASYVSDAIFLFRKEQIDLILTDYFMSPRNGVFLVRQIRKIDPQVPVFLITGYSVDDIEDEIDGLGITKIIRKPIDKQELLDAISTVSYKNQSAS